MRIAACVFSILIAFVFIFSFIKPSFAQEQNFTTNPTTSLNNLHIYTQKAMIEVMSAMICQLSGIDIINHNQPCLGIDKTAGKIGYVQNNTGAIQGMGNLIAGTFIIPIHTSDYIAHEVNNFGIVKKTYAQTSAACGGNTNGIGFCGLFPVLGLFTLFRNMAYLLFVIVFVIVGIAIMLRVNIDPRTVMTVQNQIPKFVIGLIMITFAYAIAGLLIDFMWIAVYFVINTLSPDPSTVMGWSTGTPISFISNLFNISGSGINLGGIGSLAGAAADSINKFIVDLFNSLLGKNSCDIFNLTGCVVNGFNDFLGWLGGVLAFLIFIIAIFVQLFKLWFALLKCFINVLLAVIFAPFWILAGLLPGASRSVGWGGWIRNLAGNLAPFPAILALFLIGRTIIANFLASTQTAFNPPLLGNINGTGNANTYAALIAVGFILASPSIVEQVRNALAGQQPNMVNMGFGGISTGMAGVAMVGGAIRQRLYWRGRDAQGKIHEAGPLGSAKRKLSEKFYNVKAPSRVPYIGGRMINPYAVVNEKWKRLTGQGNENNNNQNNNNQNNNNQNNNNQS